MSASPATAVPLDVVDDEPRLFARGAATGSLSAGPRLTPGQEYDGGLLFDGQAGARAQTAAGALRAVVEQVIAFDSTGFDASDLMVSGTWTPVLTLGDHLLFADVSTAVFVPVSPESLRAISLGGVGGQAAAGWTHRRWSVSLRVGVDGAVHPIALAADASLLPSLGSTLGAACGPGAVDALFRYACASSHHPRFGGIAAADVAFFDGALSFSVAVSGISEHLPALTVAPGLESQFASGDRSVEGISNRIVVGWAPLPFIVVRAGSLTSSSLFTPSGTALLSPNPRATRFFVEVALFGDVRWASLFPRPTPNALNPG